MTTSVDVVLPSAYDDFDVDDKSRPVGGVYTSTISPLSVTTSSSGSHNDISDSKTTIGRQRKLSIQPLLLIQVAGEGNQPHVGDNTKTLRATDTHFISFPTFRNSGS